MFMEVQSKMKIIEKIIDISTGKETIIEREETAEEQKQRLSLEKSIAEKLAAEKVANEAKSALLAKLGITENEAKLLLS